MNLYGTLMTAEGKDRTATRISIVWATNEPEAKKKAHEKNVKANPDFDEYHETVILITSEYLRDWSDGLFLIGVVCDEVDKVSMNLMLITSPHGKEIVGHAVKLRFAKYNQPLITGMQICGFTRIWASLRSLKLS